MPKRGLSIASGVPEALKVRVLDEDCRELGRLEGTRASEPSTWGVVEERGELVPDEDCRELGRLEGTRTSEPSTWDVVEEERGQLVLDVEWL